MKTVILFDVNETLLDLRVLEPFFERPTKVSSIAWLASRLLEAGVAG